MQKSGGGAAMKKLFLTAALIATLVILCEAPAFAAESGNDDGAELWCGTSPEMQEELCSALMQKRFI